MDHNLHMGDDRDEVVQGYIEQVVDNADWKDHGEMDHDVDEDVHKIYSGKEKHNIESSIVITTWQSAIKLPLDWFRSYGMIVGDAIAKIAKPKRL